MHPSLTDLFSKAYRESNLDHFKNIESCKYFAKKGLPQDIIDKFGELSGKVFKIKSLIDEIIAKNPDIKEKLINELI